MSNKIQQKTEHFANFDVLHSKVTHQIALAQQNGELC